MSSRYYSSHRKKNYRHNRSSFQLFSKNEKKAFYILAELIRTIIYIMTGLFKVTCEIIKYVRKMIKTHKALKKIGYDYTEIMKMVETINPRQFEFFCAELFKNSGKYEKVEVTQSTGDYGRDIILTSKIKGIKEVTFVEVKHYNKDNLVGREICQKLLGSCQMLQADKAIVITTGKYHKNAYEVARMVDNLELMDMLDIEKMILDLQPDQISRVIMRTLNAS